MLKDGNDEEMSLSESKHALRMGDRMDENPPNTRSMVALW